MTTRQAKVEIYPTAKHRPGKPDFGWRLKASNGANVGPGGEGFASRRNALRAWQAHQKAAANPRIVHLG